MRPYGTARPARRTARRIAPLALTAGLLVSLTGCSSDDVDSWKRFGLHKGVTDQSDRITSLWQGAWIAALLVGLLVWALIFYAVIVFRRKPADTGVPGQVRYNMPVEVTFTVVPLILVLVYFFFTARDEDKILEVSGTPDAVVNVVGKQWSWDFNYQDASGKPIAYESGTPAYPPTLYLPSNQSVKFVLQTRDVNHSFWVPAFQFKMDLISGRTNQFELKPLVEGRYMGKCAEMCGTDHSSMLFNVEVVSPEAYQQHLDQLVANGQGGELPGNLGRNLSHTGAGESTEGDGK